jgi:MFS family permease
MLMVIGASRAVFYDAVKGRASAVLVVIAAAHFIHDGFADVVYVLLPLWAAEFSLSFAQVGIIRTAYSGGMALFQIPAGLIAERTGERIVLVVGTLVTAAGFIMAGLAGGFVSLLAVLLVAGLGSGVQHPLASSIVSQAYETGPRRTALGTYNFSGDLGKVAVPAVVAFLAAALGSWRTPAALYGVVGLVAAVVIWTFLCRLDIGTRLPAKEATDAVSGGGWGIRDPRGFQALTLIGMIDNGTRSPFLTFLPFLLIEYKGATMAGVGVAMALLFAGGAVGKFACGMMAERVGIIRAVVITETATTLGIIAVLAAPLHLAYIALVPLGVALNGTSSVLYGTVAELVTPERRSRAYGLYYTVTIATSAIAPTIYGLLSDAVGVRATLTVVGLMVLVTIPLCLVLRSAVAEPARA